MNSNWKEEAWKTKVHVMSDWTIKTKIEGRKIYDWKLERTTSSDWK